MATTTKSKIAPRMSDEAVKAKTGKTWKDWFAILDRKCATKMTHQEIVKLLSSQYDVGPWWQQMITVTYEQQKGLRQVHEKPSGFEISVSKTVGVPLHSAYQAVANDNQRRAWLGENGVVLRKASPNKIVRMTWKDGKTLLAVAFIKKSAEKTQVVIQHSKLADAKVAAKMKSYWRGKLDRLQASLE